MWNALLRGEDYPPRPVVIEPTGPPNRWPRWPYVAALGTFLAAFELVAAILAARAQDAGMAMTVYPGRCHSLVLFDRAESARCADTVATLTLPDGRSGFAFTMDGGGIVSFTAPASGRSTEAGQTTLAVDQVNFVYRAEGERIEAKGRCEAEDPTVWRASIRCEAETAKGRVAADASSLGGPGQVLVR